LSARAQRVTNSPSEIFVPSCTKRTWLAEPKFTYSRLARKWREAHLRGQKTLFKLEVKRKKKGLNRLSAWQKNKGEKQSKEAKTLAFREILG